MKRIYYAHSIALYGTNQEERDILALKELGFDVITPNTPACDDGYKLEGMRFFEKIIAEADALAFRANPDGTINAGVANEIANARYYGKSVIELPSGVQRRGLTVEQTRAYLEEQGHR